MDKKIILTRPEHGWTTFRLADDTPGFALSDITDVPMDWLHQAVDSLHNGGPFCVSGQCEPGTMICIVSGTRSYLMYEGFIDPNEKTAEVKCANIGKEQFCRALHKSIGAYLDEWVDWVKKGKSSMTKRKEEMQRLLDELDDIFEKMDEQRKRRLELVEKIRSKEDKEFEVPLYLNRSEEYDRKIEEALRAVDRLSDGMVDMPAIGKKMNLEKYLEVEQAQLTELDLSVRAYNCLKRYGVKNFGQLSGMSLEELRTVRNIGKKATDEVLNKIEFIVTFVQDNDDKDMRTEKIRYADKINESLDIIKKCNKENRLRDMDEIIEGLPELLFGLVKHGGAKHCTDNNLRDALLFVTDPRIISTRNIEFDLREFSNIFLHNKLSKADQRAIAKAIISIRIPEGDKHHFVKECSVRFLNEILLPSLNEKCKYQVDCWEVIDWYPIILERELSWMQRAEIYNRLAYYHMWNHYSYNKGYDNHIDSARVYFETMERYGMSHENPYSGFFGDSNHEDIISEIIGGTYKEHVISILTDYARALLERVCESGFRSTLEYEEEQGEFWVTYIEDRDCDDMRNVMQGIYNALDAGCSQYERGKWENFLDYYADTLVRLMDDGGIMDGREETIRFLLHLLYDQDYWLLRCVKKDVENGIFSSEMESQRVWIERVKRYASKNESLILNIMYNHLIQMLMSSGQTLDGRSELTMILEEKVRTVDCPATMAKLGVENPFDFYGKVYRTDDCMALMKMYYDLGQMDKFEEMMEKIDDTEEEALSCIPYDLCNEDDRLKKKYDALLKLAGKTEHSYS